MSRAFAKTAVMALNWTIINFMIEVANRTKFYISQKLIKQILAKAASHLPIKAMDLSVVFVNPAEIKKLNKKYRNKDKPTDVLSFVYQYQKKYLDGEIIICYSLAKKQAVEYNQAIDAEIIKLLVHSLLHLTSYGHQEKLEQKIIKKL